MATMVESRNNSTGGHIKRASMVVETFAGKLSLPPYGLSKSFLKTVMRADLGKLQSMTGYSASGGILPMRNTWK